LHGVQARELITGGFQLDRRGVSRQVSDVSPVEYFDGFLAADEAGRCESSPQTLKTHVGAGHAPITGGLDNLHIVDANYPFAVNVDELFVEHVARQQHFTLTTHERT